MYRFVRLTVLLLVMLFESNYRVAAAFEPKVTLNLVAAVNYFELLSTFVNRFDVQISDSEVNKFPNLCHSRAAN
jgi:hypothetical protein